MPYKMKLKKCPKCHQTFIAEPYQRICPQCKEKARIQKYWKTHKQFAPFVPYQVEPPRKMLCAHCGEYTILRKPYAFLWCRNCGALLYDPKIDK